MPNCEPTPAEDLALQQIRREKGFRGVGVAGTFFWTTHTVNTVVIVRDEYIDDALYPTRYPDRSSVLAIARKWSAFTPFLSIVPFHAKAQSLRLRLQGDSIDAEERGIKCWGSLQQSY